MSKTRTGKKLKKKRSDEWREMIGDRFRGNTTTKGTSWWNNGEVNRMCKEQPGPEWVKGMLRKNK